MSVKPEKLEKIIESLIEDLGEGLVATDIWITGDVESLAYIQGRESSPDLIGFINEVTQKLDQALKGEDMKGIGDYYHINLINNHLMVVLIIDIYQQYLLVDLSKAPMGIVMNVALPNLSALWSEADKKPRTNSFFKKFIRT